MKMRYRAGDAIIREGDASDFVARILEGRVAVVREHRGGTIELGELGAGNFVGEMGVIERKPRSATILARTDVTVELIPADGFLERIAADPNWAHALLFRLSERVRGLTEEVLLLRDTPPPEVPPSDAPAPDRPAAALPAPAPAAPVPVLEPEPADPRVQSYQRSATASARIGLRYEGMPNARTVWVEHLPFRIGRTGNSSDPATVGRGGMRLPDNTLPHRLSAPHFAIDRDPSLGLVVRDLDSELGTMVNGQYIGGIFSRDTQILTPGDNTVIAGGQSSPFLFRIALSG